MSEQDRAMCAQCGGPIPPRPDPRGQRARYCSGACRARASRERAAAKWRAEGRKRAEKNSAPLTAKTVAAWIEEQPGRLAEVAELIPWWPLTKAIGAAQEVYKRRAETKSLNAQVAPKTERPAGRGLLHRPKKKSKKRKR